MPLIPKDHKAAVRHWKAIVLLLGVVRSKGRVLSLLPFVGASGQEPPREAIVLEQMLNRKGVVRAWSFDTNLSHPILHSKTSTHICAPRMSKHTHISQIAVVSK